MVDPSNFLFVESLTVNPNALIGVGSRDLVQLYRAAHPPFVRVFAAPAKKRDARCKGPGSWRCHWPACYSPSERTFRMLHSVCEAMNSGPFRQRGFDEWDATLSPMSLRDIASDAYTQSHRRGGGPILHTYGPFPILRHPCRLRLSQLSTQTNPRTLEIRKQCNRGVYGWKAGKKQGSDIG